MMSGYSKTALKLLAVIGIVAFMINVLIFAVSEDSDIFNLFLVLEIISLPLIYLLGLFLKWFFEWLLNEIV